MATNDSTGPGSEPYTDFEARDISGKTVLVTGSSRGLGKFVAQDIAARGARVILVSRKQEEIDAVAAEITEATGNANVFGYGVELSDRAAIAALAESIEADGNAPDGIHILYNNASMMPGLFKSITACDDDLIETMFRVNMDGYYFLCRHLMPLLQRAQAADPAFGVTIVNVSSSSGWMEEPLSPSLGLVGYTMTKAAENGLTVGMHELYVADSEEVRKVRGDEQKLGRIVSVHPGFVQTGLGVEDSGSDMEALAQQKGGMGALTIEQGADSLIWVGLAGDDAVVSGKTYYLRAVHSF